MHMYLCASVSECGVTSKFKQTDHWVIMLQKHMIVSKDLKFREIIFSTQCLKEYTLYYTTTTLSITLYHYVTKRSKNNFQYKYVRV